MRLLPIVAGWSIVASACVAPVSDASEPMAGSEQSIVGGTPSTAAQDSTVLIIEAGKPSCTGTLIAPNLVLTARHCVTYFNEKTECGAPLQGEVAPSLITISVGVHASAKDIAARATRFYVTPATPAGLCGADVALVLLDKDLPNANVATVRFTPPAEGEITTAVGYGPTGSGAGRRQRSDVRVLAVGPTSSTYTTSSGQSLAMHVPANDLATTESTCYGDSGGPLFDALGQVTAVASRGVDAYCEDRPTYWTSLAAFEQLLRSTASAVGHPLAEASVPRARDGAPATARDGAADESSGEASSAANGARASGTRERHDGGVVSHGCAVVVREGGPSASWLATGLALAAVACVRRRVGGAKRRG